MLCDVKTMFYCVQKARCVIQSVRLRTRHIASWERLGGSGILEGSLQLGPREKQTCEFINNTVLKQRKQKRGGSPQKKRNLTECKRQQQNRRDDKISTQIKLVGKSTETFISNSSGTGVGEKLSQEGYPSQLESLRGGTI